MKAKGFYRIGSVLLLLFALGHTFGFRQTVPEWGVDGPLALLQQVHFNVQGFHRTYYDFYVGFGLFVTVFQLFGAAIAWQLGGLSREVLSRMPLLTWGFVICFAALTVLSGKYFFVVPLVFSFLITICLLFGAWFSRAAPA